MIWGLLHPGSVLFRRDWLLRFDPLDEGLQTQAAIVELVLRLSSRGAAAVYLETSVLQCLGITGDRSRNNADSVKLIARDCREILDRFFNSLTCQSGVVRWRIMLVNRLRCG